MHTIINVRMSELMVLSDFSSQKIRQMILVSVASVGSSDQREWVRANHNRTVQITYKLAKQNLNHL